MKSFRRRFKRQPYTQRPARYRQFTPGRRGWHDSSFTVRIHWDAAPVINTLSRGAAALEGLCKAAQDSQEAHEAFLRAYGGAYPDVHLVTGHGEVVPG